MRLQRIPQQVSNCLLPFSSHFNCPQGQHFRVWSWLLVTLLPVNGGAKLKTLGDVTILLSKRRRNDGPKKIKLIVTNLDTKRASDILNLYSGVIATLSPVTFQRLTVGGNQLNIG